MSDAFDFYAPLSLPDGRVIYGAAAANVRVAQAGGFNVLSAELVNMGIRMGYQKAVSDFRNSQSRR
ncbi:hypothetical protein [Pseudomonas sp. NyZ201]|uniref:hypothetical protein n=1 Tax=Pseudomonas sp. NyZ201 TaxID=3409857 RepID=UPI003CF54B2D